MKNDAIALGALLLLAGSWTALAQDGPPGRDKEASPPSQSSRDAPAASRDDGSRGQAQREERGGGREGRAEANRDGPSKSASEKSSSDRQASEERSSERKQGEDKRAEKPASKESKDKKSAEQGDRSGKKDSKSADPGDSKPAARESEKSAEKSTEPNSDRSGKPDASANVEAKDQDAKQSQSADKSGKADPETAKRVQVAGDKADKVRGAFRDVKDIKHETNVNVDIAIGAHLPRTVEFRPVPFTVVEIVPEYRGYVFAYVDDRYVICDPDGYEVVAVLDASGGPAYASGGGDAGACTSSLTLSNEERDFILRSVQFTDEEDVQGVTIGWSVPNSIELRTFPEPILSRYGKLESCRYFVVEDQIAIVDPDDDKVVLLVEAND